MVCLSLYQLDSGKAAGGCIRFTGKVTGHHAIQGSVQKRRTLDLMTNYEYVFTTVAYSRVIGLLSVRDPPSDIIDHRSSLFSHPTSDLSRGVSRQEPVVVQYQVPVLVLTN
jgi:hypothetical protein